MPYAPGSVYWSIPDIFIKLLDDSLIGPLAINRVIDHLINYWLGAHGPWILSEIGISAGPPLGGATKLRAQRGNPLKASPNWQKNDLPRNPSVASKNYTSATLTMFFSNLRFGSFDCEFSLETLAWALQLRN